MQEKGLREQNGVDSWKREEALDNKRTSFPSSTKTAISTRTATQNLPDSFRNGVFTKKRGGLRKRPLFERLAVC